MVVITRSELDAIRSALSAQEEDYNDEYVVEEALEIVDALIIKCDEQSDAELEQMLADIEGEING